MNELMLTDPNVMNSMERLSQLMAGGRATVPEHLRGNPGDCLGVVMQAAALNINPFTLAQKSYIIGGKIGYESQLVNALIINSGLIDGRFEYKWGGDWSTFKPKPRPKKGQKADYSNYFVDESLWIQAGAKIKGQNEVSWTEAICPGKQNHMSGMWWSSPLQQAKYLAVNVWARAYAPDIILGMYTPDELQDYPQESAAQQHIKDITPQKPALNEGAKPETSRSEADIDKAARQTEIYRDAIKAVTTKADLDDVGSKIHKDKLLQSYQKDQLKQHYMQRLKDFSVVEHPELDRGSHAK